MSVPRSIIQTKNTASPLLTILTVLSISLLIPGAHAAQAQPPTIGPSPPIFFNPGCTSSTGSTPDCNLPKFTSINGRSALELAAANGGVSGAAWHDLGYDGTTADVTLTGTYTHTGGVIPGGVADGFITTLFAQNGTGLLNYMNNSIPGVSSPVITGAPICGAVSSTGINGVVVLPDSTKQYIALQWDPFYGTSPQFNLWVVNPPCAISANPGSIGCSIGIPTANDTILYDVNYTGTSNTLGARVADLTSGVNCSFKTSLTVFSFSPPVSSIYWVLVEGTTGAAAADWSVYQVTISPTSIFGCREVDATGDFHGMNGIGNFHADDDKCEDGIPNQVSSTNRGDGKDFTSTQITATTFDPIANTVTITGVGTSGGVQVAFTFVAQETGPTTPGWVSFAFSDGYNNAGPLTSGNVLLH